MTAEAAAGARRFAMLAMTGSAACWGLSTVATKSVLEAVPPFTLLAIQLSASVAALWTAMLLSRARMDRAALRGGLTGVLEPGLAYGVGVPGLALTGAASAAVIGAAEPVFAALASFLLFRERTSARLAAALAAGAGGVVMVTWAGAEAGGARRLAGDLLVLAGVAFAALYVVLSARSVARAAPLPLAAAQQSVGLVVALGLLAGAFALGAERPAALSPALLAEAAATGVTQYALAFWLYLSALRSLPVALAAQFLTLIPVFGVAGAALLLGETVGPVQAAGAAVVVAALFAAARAAPRPVRPEPASAGAAARGRRGAPRR